jgi:hypothetical protein
MLKKIGKKLWTVIGSAVLLPALYVTLTKKFGLDETAAQHVIEVVGSLVGLGLIGHTASDIAITRKVIEGESAERVAEMSPQGTGDVNVIHTR